MFNDWTLRWISPVDDPTLDKIGHPPGPGPDRRIRFVGGCQTTTTRVSESTGIIDPGG